MSGLGALGLGRTVVGGVANSFGGVSITGTPGPATVGTPYSFTPVVSGGSGTNAFSLAGSLPAGLSFSSSTGAITGTPTAAGTLSGAIIVTNAGGYAVLALTITATAGAVTAPAAPTITVTSAPTQNTIAWTDGSTGGAPITAHKLYRGTTSGAETLPGPITTASPYVDTGLTNGTTYFYRLSAVNSAGEGAQSAEVSGTPVTPITTVYRADATNADAANVIPATGGASYATTTRMPFWSQNAIAAGTVMKCLIPLRAFAANGTILEIDIPNATDFALALEYPYAQAVTGIPTNTRTQATVVGGAATVAHYVPGAQTQPYFELDIVAPVNIPANTQYGLWLTHEAVAGRTATVANMQVQMATQMANVVQRYAGALQTAAKVQSITNIANSGTNVTITLPSTAAYATGQPVNVSGTTNYNGTYIVTGNNTGTGVLTCSSSISGRASETSGTADPSHITTNAVMNATQVSAYLSTANNGSTAFMTVAAVLLPFASNSSIESCVANGNSKQAGNFEGVYGATTPDGVVHGDRSGDARGNRGAARLLWNMGKAVSQLSKGSDRDLWRMIVPSYTGTIAGTVLTVSVIAAGAVYPGSQVNGAAAGTVVTAGTLFSASASTANTTLTVSQMMQSAKALAVGDIVFANGVLIGTISALGTGTGGVGTYTLAANAATTVSNVLMASNSFTVNNSQTISSATAFTAQANYTMRSALLAAINPQRVIGMCPTNELGALPSGTAPATSYQASTAVALDAVRYNGSNFYICGALSDTTGGTTGASSAPTGTTPGVVYQDGSVSWYYIGSTLGGATAVANSQDCYGAGWVGQRRKRERLDRAAIPNAKFYGVTQTPLTNSFTETLTSAGYSYNSTTGVLTLTPANIARYNSGAFVNVTGLTPAGMNGYLVGTVSGSTVSVSVATGLAAPSGTATLNNEWQDTAGQTIQLTYTAQTAVGTGMKAWINTFLRNGTLARQVLGYYGVVDMDQYLEAGHPTTPGAETAVWGPLTDGGGNLVQATSEGGHETSYGYERAYVAAAADTAFTAAFAA